MVGIPAGLLLLWLLLLLEKVKVGRDHRAVRVVRTIADGTFALYLFHIPLLTLAVAYLPFDGSSSVQNQPNGCDHCDLSAAGDDLQSVEDLDAPGFGLNAILDAGFRRAKSGFPIDPFRP
jgi:hypothetical protein